MNSADALMALKEGNARFITGQPEKNAPLSSKERAAHAAGQSPFAIVLSCADSRVPVELIFDQNIGDVFVVRLAGNIASPEAIASIEFAVANFGSRLIVVLGHSNCGAVKATLAHLNEPLDLTPSLTTLVDTIAPAISKDDSLANAITTNAKSNAQALLKKSALLAGTEDLLVTSADYSLETGEVAFH